MIEHLNAEIVLQTITDVSIALDWLKSTFLFTRIKKNPKHYGLYAEENYLMYMDLYITFQVFRNILVLKSYKRNYKVT